MQNGIRRRSARRWHTKGLFRRLRLQVSTAVPFVCRLLLCPTDTMCIPEPVRYSIIVNSSALSSQRLWVASVHQRHKCHTRRSPQQTHWHHPTLAWICRAVDRPPVSSPSYVCMDACMDRHGWMDGSHLGLNLNGHRRMDVFAPIWVWYWRFFFFSQIGVWHFGILVWSIHGYCISSFAFWLYQPSLSIYILACLPGHLWQ